MHDSCSACGHDNRAGALFCGGCGAALVLRCGSCGTELPAGTRFCDACGAAAPASPSGATAEAGRKTVSVIFSDLADSTAMQEAIDAESVRRVMARYYEVMRATVQRHDGTVAKFIGDAVVAVFGAPMVREDDAKRAVRCAAAMAAELEVLNDEFERHWGVRLRMRTGVNTGELVVSREDIIVGDTMNTAARLQQAAPAGEVLIGETTWRLVRHEVAAEEVAQLDLKGKSEPVRVWRLVSAEAGSSAPLAGAPADPRLVARDSELARLAASLEQAIAERTCRLVTIVGSPGLGKSRLANEFAGLVGDRARVVVGHCEASGEGNTFLPVAEVVRDVAGIGEGDAADVIRAKLLALAPEDDPDRERLADTVAAVLGVSEPASAQETFWALRRGIETLAREHPLVIVLDDLHWGQPMLLDLIEHLIEWITDAPVLLLALGRPELRETREVLTAIGRRASDVIELEPLPPDQSRALVDSLLGPTDLPDELLAKILGTTQGNPLFLGELIRMLVDEGTLVHAGEEWVVAGEVDRVEVPPTITALLSARIERLRADERAVVERASVIGQQFYRGAVAELLAPPIRTGIDGHLEALRRKEMVEPEGVYWVDEPVYRFHHVLIRDAAYHLLLKEARAVLHERFADWLQDKAGEMAGEYEEVIAFHLERAHAYRRELGPLDDAGRALGARAASRLASAGRRALAREDLAAAENLLSRALECDDTDAAAVLWDLAETVLSEGDATAAANVFARYATAVVDDPQGRARAAVLQAQLANLTGDDDPVATAESVVAAALELRSLRDGAGEAKAWHVSAQTNVRLGRVGEVEAALDSALTAARAADDRRRTTAVLAAAPRAALWGPSSVVRASGRCLDVVRILRMTPGNRHLEAIALRCQAVLEAMRGRADAAREILAAGRATLEELGLTLELQELAMHAGIVELLDGDTVAAEELLRGAREGFETLGADTGAAQAAALLGRALVLQGRVDEAVAETEFAERHGGDDLKTTIGWLGVRAQALAGRDEVDEALALAERAVALAEPTDALADKADAQLALAQVLLAAGRRDDARAVANGAHAMYEAKSHLVGMRTAGALVKAAPPRSPAPVAVPEVLAERASERIVAEHRDLCNARDYERAAQLLADDCYLIDHRQLGWPDAHGRERVMADTRSAFDATPDLRLDYDEVLACDDRVIVALVAWRGHGVKAGELEFAVGAVALTEDGRFRGADYYEPGDTLAMLGRYAELGGGLSVLGDLPPERWFREFAPAYARQELEPVLALVSEDYELLDHRRLGWERVRGREAFARLMQSAWEIGELRLEVDEVLACDERVIALAITYYGTDRDSGVKWEFPVGAVCVIENGLQLHGEHFDHDDRDGMLARFAELAGGHAVSGVRPPERAWEEWARRISARDVDAFAELVADGYELHDHRPMFRDDIVGRAALIEAIGSIFAASPDIRFDLDEVIACDDRAIAIRVAWRGHGADGGGAFETPAGYVSLVDDGLTVTTDVYEYDDTEAMLARFRELAAPPSPLGGRPPERLEAELARRIALRDADNVAALFSPEYVLIDHRLMAHDNVLGPDDVRQQIESMFGIAPDLRFDVDEVLACDDRVIAMRFAIRGHAADGGGFGEVPIGIVSVIEDDVFVSDEQYDYYDTPTMLQRYAQLGGRPAALGDRPPERVWAEYVRRVALHDVDAILALGAPGFVQHDHRLVATGDVAGAEGMRALFASMFEMSSNLRVDVDEVLECDDRVIALQIAYRGLAGEQDSESEVPLGVVAVVQDGLLLSADTFAPEDRDAVLARFAELSGGRRSVLGDRPPEHGRAKETRAYNSRDLEALRALYVEDFLVVDHRPNGWGTISGRDAVLENLTSGWHLAPDIRLEIEEVVACDERVLAVRSAYRGHAADGGGEFELLIGFVTVYEAGRMVKTDAYEPDDRQAMTARYAELGGGAGALGDEPPERFLKRYLPALAARDLGGMAEMYAEDLMFVEHRLVGWESFQGREHGLSLARSAFEATTDMRIEVYDVLACDDHVIALRAAYCGHAMDGGGEFELAVGTVNVIENGRWRVYEQFDPDDRDAMLARYAALGGRTVS